jgi:cytochrome P450/NADPH-cytochrome P450 reductase
VAQPLRPRYYSPSSSPGVHGAGVAHLTVGLEDLGMCSGHLHGLREGDRLNVFLDGADGFHLQDDLSKPMLFVSAGTGFAPMLGFLWERLALRDGGAALGEAALFNGIRSARLDYVYREEVERFVADGVLDHVHVATSRDGERTYVQDLLRAQGALVWRLLEAGGYVYVCGSRPMRDAVWEAFVDVVAEHGQMPRARAEELVGELETTETRYRPDVWG